MGMCLALATVADENISRILADPPLVWQVIAPDDPEMYEEARKSESKGPSLIGRLFGAKANAARPTADLVFADGEVVTTDLDKAWHGIHYLLTGTDGDGSPPLNLLVAGGQYVGNIDVGYGPARVLKAREVQDAHRALELLSDEELRRRFLPADMIKKGIYPEIWDRDPKEDDTLGYLMEHVGTLRSVLAQASGEGRGVVVYLC